VFLFDEKGRLLLQQRAASKITFPLVWSNTCCSHPLYGYEPDEVDLPAAVADGSVNGCKAAAIRKLKHELGINSKKVVPSAFKFLTRLHYWAADVVTHGANSPWGEHEIDYILFIQANVRCTPNPEEVEAIKYVTLPELQEMMEPSSGLLWSPWFRILVEKFLVHWWADLDTTLKTDKFVDTKTIYRFDPTAEHMGGAGNAREWLGEATSPYTSASNKKSAASKKAPPASPAPSPAKKSPAAKTAAVTTSGDKSLKQGAYGKVKIHKHSIWSQLIHVGEVFAAAQVLSGTALKSKLILKNEDEVFCNDILNKVSRSFAEVIRQLPMGLSMDVLIFYLALRGLDTVEDDMQAFADDPRVKIDHLKVFYKYLSDETWCMKDVGEGDEKRLLEEFYRCSRVFNRLNPESREVIADITRRMGEGMSQYVEKDLGQGTVTIKDYDLYCHYVAGLVGEGLSKLFTCCGYEDVKVAGVSKTLANTMGLFLQKTNIIRDYLEDYVDGRAFWPQQVWKKYTTTEDLGELAKPENRTKAIHCLNELVTNALECVPECLQYLDLLQTPEVYRFCAIPQVMAIATLSELYNNGDVFTGVVKIRKGMACKLILDSGTVYGTHKAFYDFATDILSRIKIHEDPSARATAEICLKIRKLTENHAKYAALLGYLHVFNSLSSGLMALNAYRLYNTRHLFWFGGFNFALREEDIIRLAVLALCVMVSLFYRHTKKNAPKF
jgi:farnesyl-diphosphate farnesyltransferase